MKKFYLTTPLYYVNDKPHIGHAYTTVAADVLARWKRLKGEPVFFLTGTDEHGSKIAQAAEKHGRAPQAYVDQVVRDFQSLWKILNISQDDFIRTTEPRHQRVVQEVFVKLHDQGDIYKGFYEDWYCVSCESFWLESELVNRHCPNCGRPVEKLKEETYFFKLSKYQGALEKHMAAHPAFVSPHYRAQEMLNFVKSGLKDISVSRLNEAWGIPLPFDPKHRVYVWFDALLNYVSAAGYRAAGPSAETFQELWPADVHFVGKEILRFHTVIWPAMLLALDLPLPAMVFAHGWWTVEGDKMSKSKGNVVDPVAVTQEYGVDGFRYFLLREMPFGMDGDFSLAALKKRYNSELANDLGNLFSRTLTLIEKNMEGVVAKLPWKISFELKAKETGAALDKIAFHEALDQLMSVVKRANLFMEQNAPWKLVKEDPAKGAAVLSEMAAVLAWLAAGFYPFMPEICERMWKQLGQDGALQDAAWEVFQDPLARFAVGKKVNKEGILFPRKP